MSSPRDWPTEWPGPHFGPGEVHLGRLWVDHADPQLADALTSDELDRASSFHFEVDRARYVASRGGLRSLLARYLGVEPRSVRLGIGSQGKPHLAGVSESDLIHFNVSHSESLIVVGLTKDVHVGVDVEAIRDDLPHQAMATRFFSPDELSGLNARPTEEQLDHFYAIWTRKEAYLKGIGEGLHMSPESFSVAVEEVPSPVVHQSGSEPWWTSGVDVAEGFRAALALPQDDWKVKPFEIADLTS